MDVRERRLSRGCDVIPLRLKVFDTRRLLVENAGDDVRLAYATIGNGPPLVKASNWLTHLDFEWGSPIWRHWYAALSLHHRLVRYESGAMACLSETWPT